VAIAPYDPCEAPQVCDSFADTPMWRWAFLRVGDYGSINQEGLPKWGDRLRDWAFKFMQSHGCCGAIASTPGCPHLEGICRHQWDGARYDMRDRVSLEVFEDEEKYLELRDVCPKFIAQRIRKAMSEIIELDASVDRARKEIAAATGTMARSIAYAKGIKAIEAALNKHEADFMALQNNPLGFMTDNEGGYPWTIVRSAITVGLLRGFLPINNEFNIIARRFYGAKEGYIRLVREFPGVTNVSVHLSVPVIGGEETALVGGYLQYDFHGKPMRRDFQKVTEGPTAGDYRISIRVNKGMGADAILGKATRKAYARVWEQLTGLKADDVPENDADEPNAQDANTIEGTATPVEQEALPAPRKGEDMPLKQHEINWLDSCRAGMEKASNLHEINAIVDDTKKRKPPMAARVEEMAIEHRKRFGAGSPRREAQTA